MSTALTRRIALGLAVVALPLGMLATWVGAYVGSTDRYVSTVAPLADDPAVKRAAVAYIERETLATLDSRDRLGDALRTLDLSCIGVDASLLAGFADLANAFLEGTALGETLRAQIRPELERTIHEAVTEAVEGESFERVWVQANRQAHREILAALEDEPLPDNPADQVLLPLTEISTMISGFLACPNLITPETAAQIRANLTLVDADELRSGHTAYQALGVLRWVLPVLFVLGVVGALVLSPSRRRTGWQLLVGAAVGMGVLQVVLAVIRALVEAPAGSEEILDAIWGALTRSIDVASLAVGVIALLGGVALWFVDQTLTTTPSRSEDEPRAPLG